MDLSLIISNRNDVMMLLVTIRSAIEEMKPLEAQGKKCEIVICDNSEPVHREQLNASIPSRYIKEGKVKMIYQDFPCLFTARDEAAKVATGTYMACVDSHMILGRDMLLDLVNFMDRKAGDPKVGFAHAPICWVHQHESASRHDRDIVQDELGPWGRAHPEERKITWKGMPWMCRRDWYLDSLGGYGALSEFRLSWGGGDMHIGVKPWLLGYENWAVPTSPAIHLGPLPHINGRKPKDRYRVYAISGASTVCIGFLVSCYVLGGEPMMHRNKTTLSKRFKQIDPAKEWNRAISYGKREKAWLDERKVMTFETFLETQPWNS